MNMDKGGEYECVSEFKGRQRRKRRGTDVEEGEYRQKRLEKKRRKRKNSRTEEVDGDEKQGEQLRVPGSRPGPTPAFLGGLTGPQLSPSVKWVWGLKLHSPLLLCWSGGEAGRENRSNDEGSPALGHLPWQWRSLPPTLIIPATHPGFPATTAKASLGATSWLECPPSCPLITSYVIFKAQRTPQRSEGSGGSPMNPDSQQSGKCPCLCRQQSPGPPCSAGRLSDIELEQGPGPHGQRNQPLWHPGSIMVCMVPSSPASWRLRGEAGPRIYVTNNIPPATP